MRYYWIGSPWMVLMPAFVWLVFLCIVAVVVYLLVRRSNLTTVSGPADDPLRLLSQRYARGEIDREQYLRMRSDIEGRS